MELQSKLSSTQRHTWCSLLQQLLSHRLLNSPEWHFHTGWLFPAAFGFQTHSASSQGRQHANTDQGTRMLRKSQTRCVDGLANRFSTQHTALFILLQEIKYIVSLTWSLLRSTVSVVLLPPGFAAFQNCFCAEYLFMGHSLKRQSGERGREKSKSHQIFRLTPADTCLPDTTLYICELSQFLHSHRFTLWQHAQFTIYLSVSKMLTLWVQHQTLLLYSPRVVSNQELTTSTTIWIYYLYHSSEMVLILWWTSLSSVLQWRYMVWHGSDHGSSARDH